MTARDLLAIAFGNLRRMKLRTFLTTSGVIIAITAFVAMLSFGAGSQQNIEKEFDKLGLFSTMQVFPLRSRTGGDSVGRAELDVRAIERLGRVPGVRLVYPYDAFAVEVRTADSLKNAKAQALPAVAMDTRLHSSLLAGKLFGGDSVREVIVTDQFARDIGFARPDSMLGTKIAVTVRVSTVDSGLGHILRDRGVSILDRLKQIKIDSLLRSGSRSRLIRAEANEILRRFVNGFLNSQEGVTDTLTVCGIREMRRGGPSRGEALVVPVATARHFTSRGPAGGPTELFMAMSKGTLFGGEEGNGRTFPQVTLDVDPHVPFARVKDSVQAMGFRVFSFAEEFQQIQQFFFYFDIALGVIGMIALITASLGIVNTMVMSITERRKEIGILKSLGADEPDIRRLFLVESGVIGAIGTVVGIGAGWLVTRIVSVVAQGFMRERGMPEMDIFARPLWLIATALLIGIGVSVVAGLYPAARAAHVDPVEALRGE